MRRDIKVKMKGRERNKKEAGAIMTKALKTLSSNESEREGGGYIGDAQVNERLNSARGRGLKSQAEK